MKYGKSKVLICEIMGFVRTFWKEAYLPKTSISGQIVSEIVACMTGALWAKWGERDISRGARHERETREREK